MNIVGTPKAQLRQFERHLTERDWHEAQPGVEVHVYAADHGFNCDQRGSYNEAAAKVARQRTLDFFAKHLG